MSKAAVSQAPHRHSRGPGGFRGQSPAKSKTSIQGSKHRAGSSPVTPSETITVTSIQPSRATHPTTAFKKVGERNGGGALILAPECFLCGCHHPLPGVGGSAQRVAARNHGRRGRRTATLAPRHYAGSQGSRAHRPQEGGADVQQFSFLPSMALATTLIRRQGGWAERTGSPGLPLIRSGRQAKLIPPARSQ